MVNPIKRVAAIHDLSGYGKSSLTVVTPILSSMKVQVCPLPTAVLSTHTDFDDFHFIDLTDHMEKIIAHWKELDLSFDGIYSGFLGSYKQVDIVKNFIKHFKKEEQYVIVDPVMGDNGSLYPTLGKEMVESMKELIKHADIITPNLTEAALLLDEEFNSSMTEESVIPWIKKLSSKGPRIVIVTSVPDCSKKTAVLAYDKKYDKVWKVSCDYIPANYPGTGDSFTSVILGSLLSGDSLPIALDRAMQFTSMAIRSTFGYSRDCREGILLERILDTLNSPVQMCSYELMDH